MVKIFVAKAPGEYELPTRYAFVAPKIGQTPLTGSFSILQN
ncbi:hypothetical protein AB0L47_36865 [Streptomyces bobili]